MYKKYLRPSVRPDKVVRPIKVVRPDKVVFCIYFFYNSINNNNINIKYNIC